MSNFYNQTGTNIPGSSVVGCGRWKKHGFDNTLAEIQVKEGSNPKMLNHFHCGSVWSCDHCARIRVSKLRSWIRACLIPALDKQNLTAGLLTFTISHKYSDNWADVLNILSTAYSLFDKRMSKIYAKMGCKGKLKALEAPVGKNGLHPHFHVLLTYSKGFDVSNLLIIMQKAWEKAVFEAGGFSNSHGFDFKPDCINDYVAKIETSHELATHGTKQARQNGRMLGQLLDRAAVGCSKSSEEWLRAQKALGGRVRFHAGSLPKNLGICIPSDWEDPDLLLTDLSRAPVTVLSYPQRLHLKATAVYHRRAGLALILRSARSNDINRVLRTVSALCAATEASLVPSGHVGSFYDWDDNYFSNIT